MQILFLIIMAYLLLPVIGQIYLYVSGDIIAAGNVSLEFIIKNIIFASINFFIISFGFFLFKDRKWGFFPKSNDKRSMLRISIIITLLCASVFVFSGYDYLIKGSNRGDIRVSFGAFGFIYKWITIYAIPVLMFLTSVIYVVNERKKFKIFVCYIFLIGALSAIFTGYKYVIVFTFIPVFFVFFYKRNIFKSIVYISPVVLLLLTVTTKMVMSFDTYGQSFSFLLHRMTVMSAFGTIGVYNYFPDGADFNNAIKLSYSVFGNNINEILFGIDSKTTDVLDVNLARKITYMVYPAWETAISGTSNLTITNFGDSVYLLGKLYFLYAIFAGFFVVFLFNKLAKNIEKGNILKSSIFLIYILAVILSWFNSTTFFVLFSLPVLIYLIMTFLLVLFIFNVKIR